MKLIKWFLSLFVQSGPKEIPPEEMKKNLAEMKAKIELRKQRRGTP